MSAKSNAGDLGRPLATEDLRAYFLGGAKPRAQFRIGIEQEKIGVLPDGLAVPYDGQRSISAILEQLIARGFGAQREDGHVIALERNGERITIEPGGQLELSGATLSSARACRDALFRHVREVQEIATPMGIRFLGVGARPFGSLETIPWLPKRRYTVMRSYLPSHGRLAHDMMKRTATVQANFDYESEADATDKIRTALGVTSIVTALFAASPITDDRPNGFKSFRAAIWLETDDDRCGILPFAFAPAFSFADYVEWALDVPMFFVVRAGVYQPTGGMTFRRFMHDGFGDERPTLQDWEVHLSTLFPEVRLKKYIELRGADAGPIPMASGLGALWRGLLEDAEARRAAWALVAAPGVAERLQLRRDVPRAGLGATLGGHRLSELAVELLRIARTGLSRLSDGTADAALLDPLDTYAQAARCPADDLLADFTRTGGDPRQLIPLWELKADPP
ncbi:MAG TPA: glutamate-cysteine ligase family protein [Polyangia bacterium]|jgi:glutamate--cysteine ligase|nr:glutamate-cysteine ligase family protein [Polyangia bacterium]